MMEGQAMVDYGYADKIAAMSQANYNPTVAQNIDNRIKNLEDQVERLKRVKEELAKPTGLLNVSIDDLRFAMNY